MATKTKIKGLNIAKMKKDLMINIVIEQSDRLVNYAKREIMNIGNAIAMHPSTNNLDRKGNLLDSLCWGVVYNGKLYDSGFYREQKATEESYLHEWSMGGVGYGDMFPVYGHGLAKKFIRNFANRKSNGNGWTIFFAVLAPYWGYWEEGFQMKGETNKRINGLYVMTQMYDRVTEDLRPMETKISVNVPKYNTNRRNNLERLSQSFSDYNYRETRHYSNIPQIKKR